MYSNTGMLEHMYVCTLAYIDKIAITHLFIPKNIKREDEDTLQHSYISKRIYSLGTSRIENIRNLKGFI